MVTERYSRQILFSEIGQEGQEKISRSSVVIVGCGALGTFIATILVRAGVGKVRMIDRDFIEYHNLQRQILFIEEDIETSLPKAIAAERHLKKVNSSIEIEGIVADVNYSNIEKLVGDVDLIMDGSDNVETRFLINDVSLKHSIPWIYGGAIFSTGMSMTIIPGETACLRCFWHTPGVGSHVLTCDTTGIIAPVPAIVGSVQAAEALKILVGAEKPDTQTVVFFDVWERVFKVFPVTRREDCPACNGNYEYLDAKFGVKATALCGQNSIQILNPAGGKVSYKELAYRLNHHGNVTYNDFMLNFTVGSNEMVIFPDGRAIVKNTDDESFARSLYAKYIGN